MVDLTRLLKPRSVALIGGSWALNVKAQLQRLGFRGAVWPVHPQGRFKAVADLPEAPDAAFIAVNRRATVEVTRALAARGAGGAICFASGFQEAGADGAGLQDALVAAAGTMPLLGPNCYGLVNYLDAVALWPDVHGGHRIDTGVALITQSSNILINMSMQQRGVPLAYLIAVGNSAQIGLPEVITALDADPRVTALGLHIEGFGDAAAFHTACSACRTPILALKTGETDAAKALTLSHTASLSGSDDVASAFLDRCGVGRVRSLEGLLEGLKVLHQGGPLGGMSLASVSCSGGEASLMADCARRFGFDFPSLEGLDIAASLNPLVQVSNPFDYHTFDWGNAQALTPAFTRVLAGRQALTLFVLDWPKEGVGDTSGFETTVAAILDAKQASPARAALLASYPENMPEALAKRLLDAGLIPLCGMQAGLEGVRAAVLPPKGDFLAQRLTPDLHHQRPTLLDEIQAKAQLRAAGLDSPLGHRLTSAEDARALGAGPWVFKAVDAKLAHKSEVGGVLLDVSDPVRAYQQLARLSPVVLAEQKISDAVAELIVGYAQDPVVGGHLMIGAGGVLAELLDDTALLLLPFTQAEAQAALDRLKISKVLAGYRGKPAAHRASLVATLMQVQTLVLNESLGLLELDINPLMVTPSRAVVADALMVLQRGPSEFQHPA